MSGEIEKIRIYGDPVLRRKAEPVEDFNAELRDLADSLVDSMYANQSGIGLAAPQIGVSKRLLVIDRSFGEEFDNILVMVNPEIVEADGETTFEEGCLSVPGIFEPVSRPVRIFARYRDVDGVLREIESDDFLARVIQHETDHLDGILFIDRLGTIKRQLLQKQLRVLAGEGALDT